LNLAEITPLVLTYNESANIEPCLAGLAWAPDVVIVDSYSSDDTLERAARFANVRSFQRRFDNHSAQWNFGLQETSIATPWILALDADYRPTRELLDEIRALTPPPEVSAYYVPFTYCVFGHPLRGSVYGPVAALFRREQADYVQDGHTQRLRLQSGSFAQLQGRMLHDDRKSLGRWLASQQRYMELEARLLLERPGRQLGWADRLRKAVVLAPWLMFGYCLLIKAALLDGWPGWYYACQRLTAELILSLKLIEARLHVPRPEHPILPGDGE
jgi:glycosyltransferase involved in cell wall biosynthesis